MTKNAQESRLITRTEAARVIRKTRKTVVEWILLGYITEYFLFTKKGNKKNVYGYLSESEVVRVSQMRPTERKGTHCKKCSNRL